MIELGDLLVSLESHAAASGHFERVNRHEPKSAPGNGVYAAIWLDAGRPCRSSGLASTSYLIVANIRVGLGMLVEPQDEIDENVYAAVDALMSAYNADFTLDGQIRSVDVLGAEGQPLSFQAGYLAQDSKHYRIIVLKVPMIVNDAFTQTP